MRSHNRRGSPKRLGKPGVGESRYPTTGELECAGMHKRDLIVIDISGELSILRCERMGFGWKRSPLPLLETKIIEECLEEYWSR